MDNSRLPVEICEHIIDSFDDCNKVNLTYFRNASYKHWCRTALVCSAWVPRTRFNLYRTVPLIWCYNSNLIIQTLEENSHLVPLVVELIIGVAEKYIPFPRLARLLSNCVILRLDGICWEYYPSYFADTCLYPFSLLGIVDLSLCIRKSTARSLLRFIHSLAMLEELTIMGDTETAGLLDPYIGPVAAHGARRLQNKKPAPLSNLKSLKLEYKAAYIRFPPNYFGDAVVDLHLNLNDQTSTEVLQCIQNLHRLQTLNLIVCLDDQDDTNDPLSMSKVRTLFSVLTSVPSGSPLHTLSLCLRSRNGSSNYHVDRSGLLDLLVGADMLKVLDGFPSLSHLSFELDDIYGYYDMVWWKEEMVHRLPSRLHAVTIKFRNHHGDNLLTNYELTTWRTQENTGGFVTNGLAFSPLPLPPQLDQMYEFLEENAEEEEEDEDDEKDTLEQKNTGFLLSKPIPLQHYSI